jgi:hypothetical protein
MQTDLVAPKLYFPHRHPAAAARQRLVGRLQSALSGRLITLCAPAEHGKTTLLAEWRSEPGSGCRLIEAQSIHNAIMVLLTRTDPALPLSHHFPQETAAPRSRTELER